MAEQDAIREVVLRCRDCGVVAKVTERGQTCHSYRCAIDAFRDSNLRWSGWEIAHITRAEAA